jgi:hypothetical protein
MKISMSVMIILTTLFCVLPFAWFMFIGKNNSRKKEKLFKDAIKDENLSFNTKEQWNNNFIGIDESKNILMFIKLIKQEASILKIDLNEIKSCQINKKTRDFKRENKMETELQSLDLELAFLTKSEIVTLNFYDINDEFSEEFEMKRAEKWQTLIQQSKLKISSNKRAA